MLSTLFRRSTSLLPSTSGVVSNLRRNDSNNNSSLIGTKVPSVKVATWKDGPQVLQSDTLFENKKLIVFAIPGAYTGTCQNKHMPSFINNLDSFKKLNVDVACLGIYFIYYTYISIFIFPLRYSRHLGSFPVFHRF